jgi:hypothetical protein
MALEPTKHVNGRMWPPGVSGNPNGRPVGSRTAFGRPHTGGVIPSRPTSATAASQVPSAFFAQAGMKIFAPGFRLAFSPGIKFRACAHKRER